jgi:two-component system sensor histidine kinase NreB
LSNDQKRSYPEVIGQNVVDLLAQLDRHIPDTKFRDGLKQSLKQLTELKFALDESSIVAVTDRQGRIQYVNDKFCEISKYPREELLGQDHRIINSGYHNKSFMKELWQKISAGEVWHGEIKNRAKDGTYYWVNTTIVPLMDENEKSYQYLAIRNEVTQLKQVEAELQQMMSKVLRIQEDERKRFSRELHDGIGQSLFSLLIQMDRMIGEREDPEIEKIRMDVSQIIEEVRGLAWKLRPSVLDDLGVVPAIRTYIENFSLHYGIHVKFKCDMRKRLEADEETTIYRVIQEALTNVAKYADVSEANVVLSETDEHIEVRIEDKGKGFIRDRNVKGVGLFSIEERARGIEGKVDILSNPGMGTKVTLYVQKKENN